MKMLQLKIDEFRVGYAEIWQYNQYDIAQFILIELLYYCTNYFDNLLLYDSINSCD